MLRRRFFMFSVGTLLLPVKISFAHSPWGQYQVYRQKHLLVLSSRDDELSYPFSKELVTCLDKVLPTAKARPARAVNLKRAFDLLRTDQFQFALFTQNNIEKMRTASGDFAGKKPVDLRTLLQFGDMQMVVRHDFPQDLVATVTHNLIKCRDDLSIAVDLNDDVLRDPYLHQGAKEALSEYFSH